MSPLLRSPLPGWVCPQQALTPVVRFDFSGLLQSTSLQFVWVVTWVGVVPALILLIPSSIPHPHPCQGMMEVLPDRCVPIAKRELLWAGSAGLACWLAGVIFIDRKRTGDAISVMSEVAQTLLTQDVSPPAMGAREQMAANP